MFDIAPTELILVAVVALVIIGPKDLPKAMRVVGKWVGKARAMARHFRSGLDTMMREAELEELEKQWREQNEAIMREFPRIDGDGLPVMTATAGEPADSASDGSAPNATGSASSGADESDPTAVVKPETHDVPPKDGPLP